MTAFKPTPETEEKAASSGVTVTLKGRVKESSKVETENSTFYRTLVVVPAKDSYSHPKTFAVNADRVLGKDNADVTVTCGLTAGKRTATSSTIFGSGLLSRNP